MSHQPERPEQLLLTHDGFVRALARSLLADKDAAEDVAQDTWVAALERGAAAVSLPSWLAGVVRKRAHKHVRGQERRTRREREVARGEGTPSNDEILEREAVRARVVAAVLALDEPYRECVLLRFFESLPPRAIAARRGVPVETVRTRLKRALETLRARLDRAHGGEREAWSLALMPWASEAGVVAGSALLAPLVLGLGVLALVSWLVLRAFTGEPAAQRVAVTAAVTEPTSAPEVRTPEAAKSERELVPEPSVQPLAAETGSLRATVRWSDGTPAEGIHARLEGSTVESPYFRAWRGETDEQGGLLLADVLPGRAFLTLDRADTRSVEIEAGAETTLELTLPRGFDVEGVVVDHEGVPVAGAELWLSDIYDDDFTGEFVGTTGTDGHFELRSCATGQEIAAFAAGHAPSLLASLNAEEGTRLFVRLVLLGAGGQVAGTVRGPEGELVAGAQVLVGSEMHEFRRAFVPGEGELVGTMAPPQLLRTDAEGRFRGLGVAPGRVPLVVRAEGCAVWRSALELEPEATAEIEVTLVPESSLVGCVRDEHGAPRALARVTLLGRYGALDSEVASSGDGTYRLGGLPAGKCVVQVQLNEAGSAQAELEFVAGEERRWNPVVGLGLTLAGRVLDESGAPLSDWSLEAVGEIRQERPSFGSSFTDEEGRFFIKSLEDMPYRLTLEAPGSSVAVLELGGIRPAREECVLRVPASRRPSARVRGQIVDAAGATPANLALELATANLGLPSEVEAEGNFEVGPLVPGLYTLRVRAQGHVEHVFGPHRLAPEETWDLGVLTLEPAGSLVVRAQRPTEAATLEPWFRVLRRSADGLFELGKVEAVGDVWRREALAPGEYALEVGGHLVAAALVPFELHSGETCTLEIPLVLGLAREIHVRAAPDLGLARVRLRLWTSAGELVVDNELYPRSPGDYHSFGSFAPGTYRVVAELTDGPRIEAELRVTPDETTPLELELR